MGKRNKLSIAQLLLGYSQISTMCFDCIFFSAAAHKCLIIIYIILKIIKTKWPGKVENGYPVTVFIQMELILFFVCFNFIPHRV